MKKIALAVLTLSLISTHLDASWYWPFSSTPPTQEELNRQLWDEFSTDACDLSKAEKLVKAGANVDTRGPEEWNLDYTILTKICDGLKPHSDYISFLVSHGADVNYKVGHKQRTPLHLLAAQPTFPIEEPMEVLISHGAEINVIDIDGNTPLDCAESEKAKAFLIKHGALTSEEETAFFSVMADCKQRVLLHSQPSNALEFAEPFHAK